MTNVPIFSPGRTNVTRSEVRIIIHLKRQYEYHLSQSYFQSFLLGVLAYLTFWIDVSNFSDRCIDLLPFFLFSHFLCMFVIINFQVHGFPHVSIGVSFSDVNFDFTTPKDFLLQGKPFHHFFIFVRHEFYLTQSFYLDHRLLVALFLDFNFFEHWSTCSCGRLLSKSREKGKNETYHKREYGFFS